MENNHNVLPSSRLARHLPIILLILLFVAGGVFAFNFISQYQFKDLDGTIYLTLESKGLSTIEGNFVSNVFTLDVSSGELNELIPNSKQSIITSDTSSGGLMFVLSISPIDKNNPVQQIYTYDSRTNAYAQITRSPIPYKRLPTWSPNNTLIAFVVLDSSLADEIGPVERFSVYVTDLMGNETFITSGTQPKWLPDGRLLILKNDGLHIFNLKGQDIMNIWKSEGDKGVLSNTTIDLTEDGSQIAWSAPDWGTVEILNVLSWEPYNSGEQTSIEDYLFWPTFSPDGNFLAAYEFPPDSNVRRLIIYNINTKKKSEFMDLSKHRSDSIFITDWSN